MNKYPGGYIGPGLGSIKVVKREVPRFSDRTYGKYGGYTVRTTYPGGITGIISKGLRVSRRLYERYKEYIKGYPFRSVPSNACKFGVCVNKH